MTAPLLEHPIFARWPARHPERIQLFSLPTPNGIKVSAMLEETGLPYEPHLIDFSTNDQFDPAFLALNPNNKIPAIIDPDGPSGPLPLWESGAILIYLAEKTGQFLSPAPRERIETLQWLMWQMGGLGPMFGQLGFFHAYAGAQMTDKTARDRYSAEATRLLTVLDQRLAGRDFVMGDAYSIADMAIWPWVRTLSTSYAADDLVGLEQFAEVLRWRDACLARPASQKAINIPAHP